MQKFAASVPEFRRVSKGNLKHKLRDVIMLEVMASLSSCVTRPDILAFGKKNLKKLQRMGLFRAGLPSEPTLCRIDKGIDSKAMADLIAEFTKPCKEEKPANPRLVCIDGKATRGTTFENGRAPDIVSAFSYNSKVTIATEMCEEKSNEIRAIPLLLDKLQMKGNVIVTIDAMGCQKQIVDKIRQLGYHFVIELKANQKSLRYNIEDNIKKATPISIHDETVRLEHGRIESRSIRTFNGADLEVDLQQWGGKMTVVEVTTQEEKKSNGKKCEGYRLYITDLDDDAEMLGNYTRAHWAVEVNHWHLDRNFKQDYIKRKTKEAARNMDTIMRIATSSLSLWKNMRKKTADKTKGISKLLRTLKQDFPALLKLLSQN